MESVNEWLGEDALKKILRWMSKSDNRIRLLLVVGLSVIALIFVTDCFKQDTRSASAEVRTAAVDYDAYTAQLEARLTELISSVDGAGSVKVMVTLECGTEYVYASGQKTTSALSENTDAGGRISKDEKRTGEENIILIDGAAGEEPLILKEITPTVAGVVVVCAGADDVEVKQRIVDIVTTALGTSSNRVCVTRMG